MQIRANLGSNDNYFDKLISSGGSKCIDYESKETQETKMFQTTDMTHKRKL